MPVVHVLLAEDNVQQARDILSCLDGCADIAVAGTAADGEQALDMVRQLQPDVVILDMLLPRLDGLSVQERLNLLPPQVRPRTILLSSLTRQDFIDRAIELNVSCWLPKPVDLYRLTDCIREYGIPRLPPAPPAAQESGNEESQQRLVSQLLIRIGVSPHLTGHRYVHRAILLAVNDPSLLTGMLARLYPAVARAFDVSAANVEHDIRFAILRAWENGGAAVFNKLLGRSPEVYRDRPSNREFIALLAERVRLRRQD